MALPPAPSIHSSVCAQQSLISSRQRVPTRLRVASPYRNSKSRDMTLGELDQSYACLWQIMVILSPLRASQQSAEHRRAIICWSPKQAPPVQHISSDKRGPAVVSACVSSHIDMPDYDTTLLKRAPAPSNGLNGRAPDYDKTLLTIIPTSGSMLVRAVLRIGVCR